MKLFLILVSTLFLLASISLTNSFPVDSEEKDEIKPENLKPAFDSADDNKPAPDYEYGTPPMIEIDEPIYEDETETEDSAGQEDDEDPQVPILIPGKDDKENIEKRSATEISPPEKPNTEKPEAEESESAELEQGSDEKSEEGEEPLEQYSDEDLQTVEYATGDDSTDEESEEMDNRNTRSAPIDPDSKPEGKPKHRPGHQVVDDAVIIEACEDYEERCSSASPTRSDEPVCKSYREKCESRESGQFIGTFFCPNAENGEC